MASISVDSSGFPSSFARSARASRRISSRTPLRSSSSRSIAARPLHLQEFLDPQPAEEEPGAGVAGDGDRLARGDCLPPVGLQRLHRLAPGVVEVLVGRMVGRDQGDLDGLRDGEEARGPDRLEPDERIGVGGQLLEPVEGLGDAVAPDAEDPGGGGPGVEVGRGEHAIEQLDVDDVLVLMGPEGFGQVVLIIGVGLVEPGGPGLEGGDDLARNPARRARSWPGSGPGPRGA